MSPVRLLVLARFYDRESDKIATELIDLIEVKG